MNGEKEPVFTPPSSPHGSDEEDDGVNLEGENSKAAPSSMLALRLYSKFFSCSPPFPGTSWCQQSGPRPSGVRAASSRENAAAARRRVWTWRQQRDADGRLVFGRL